jgi:hypothetical protein
VNLPESSRQEIFHSHEKITAAKNFPAKNHPAENYPANNHPHEEFSGKEWGACIKK